MQVYSTNCGSVSPLSLTCCSLTRLVTPRTRKQALTHKNSLSNTRTYRPTVRHLNNFVCWRTPHSPALAHSRINIKHKRIHAYKDINMKTRTHIQTIHAHAHAHTHTHTPSPSPSPPPPPRTHVLPSAVTMCLRVSMTARCVRACVRACVRVCLRARA